MSKRFASSQQRSNASRISAFSVAIAAALALPTAAGAFEFDTGNEDLSMRWDNTVRLNVLSRVASQDEAILGNVNYDDADRNWDTGSLFTRFDVLSEFDVVWKRSLGFRVSAAGWWDAGYDDNVDNKSVATSNNLENGMPALGLSGYSKRYANGPSGEFLDVFAFAKFNIGDAPVNIKLGQTTVYWGEGLLLGGAVHGISYSQNPIDVWKGLATPGAEAKELFRPRVGLNVQSQVTDTLSLAAQYFFNWQTFDNQAYRFPEAGTYLSPGDPLLWGSDSYIVGANPFVGAPGVPASAPAFLRAWRGEDIEPDENSGNYGIALRWSPEWANATIGAYYRRTYDMQPQLMLTPGVLPTQPTLPVATCQGIKGQPIAAPGAATGVCIVNPQATNPSDLLGKGRLGDYNLAFGEDIDIYGLSLSKSIGGVSVGAELSYRENMPLLSEGVTVLTPETIGLLKALNKLPAGVISTTDVPSSGTPGTLGNTMHVLVNLLGIIGENPLFDTASYGAELTWMQWLDVTQNEAVFKGRKKTDKWAAYTAIDKVGKNYYGLGVNFTPTWFQVRPGMDMIMPLSWSQGISGNSAVTSGGQDGAGTFGIGLAADFYQRFRVDLKYVGFYGDYSKAANGSVSVFNGVNAVISDRDFIALTLKTTF